MCHSKIIDFKFKGIKTQTKSISLSTQSCMTTETSTQSHIKTR